MRWVVLTLVFAITIVGYADRQVISILKPELDRLFGWSGSDYALITTGFQIAIALSLLGAGRFLDRVGLRWGFAVGLAGWSVAAIGHAFARTVRDFLFARIALGIFESVGTPAGIKAIRTFFGPGERGFAVGVMNVAPNLAAVTTPLLVTGLYAWLGWRGTIIVVGVSGLLCIGLWLALPSDKLSVKQRTQVGASAASLAVSEPFFADRHLWAIAAAKFLTDNAWWFLLYWLPDFFHRQFDLDMRHIGWPLACVYVMAAGGAFLGGWIPLRLERRGVSLNRARKTTMLGFALIVLPIALAPRIDGLSLAVILIGLALAGHQGFATNIFALAADAFPLDRIGSAIGFGAFCGNVGGALSLQAAGLALDKIGTVEPLFYIVAVEYLVALGVIQILAPRLRSIPI
jgi:ACS family hexuronate transporter-like MFS transporter